MTAENSDQDGMKLAHVLFMDIVSYSMLPTDKQSRCLRQLQEVVRGTAEVKRAQANNQLISLATGDGIALVFFNDPMAPVQCALEISKGLKGYPDIKLRMGVHSGPVNEIQDVNERVNVAGSGINMAQRVMDSGDAGHILLSRRVAEDLGQYSSWQPFLHDLKEVEVKHGVRVHVFNLYTGEAGNKELPHKVRKRKKRNLAPAIALVALGVVGACAAFLLTFNWPTRDKPSVPSRPESDFKLVLQKKTVAWTDAVFSAQAPDGGIKTVTSGAQSITQVWTTAQALVGVLEGQANLEARVPNIKSSFDYINKIRRTNPDGGWNLYGNQNPFTITEIGGWVTLAHIKSLHTRTPLWSEPEKQEVLNRIARDLSEITRRQESGGGWRPIVEEGPDFVRTYSTVIALWSFAEAINSPIVRKRVGNKYDENIRRGLGWLLQTYKPGQGWLQSPTRAGQENRFDGLTAQALFVLSRAATFSEFAYLNDDPTYRAARRDFLNHKELSTRSIEKDNSSIPDADVAFYGSEFMAEGSTFLWFPWTLLELTELSSDQSLNEEDRQAAVNLRVQILNANAAKLDHYLESSNLTYLLAENLFCVSSYVHSSFGSADTPDLSVKPFGNLLLATLRPMPNQNLFDQTLGNRFFITTGVWKKGRHHSG